MKPHQWLGVPRVPAPHAELRPAVYVAGSAVAILAILFALRAVRDDGVTARGTAPEAPTPGLVAIQGTAEVPRIAASGAAPAPQPPDAPRVALALAPEAPVVSMELAPDGDDAEDLSDDGPGERGRARAIRHASSAGILGADGLDDAIDRVAGDRDVGGGMAAVGKQARDEGWEAVDPQGCGERCFGTRLTKRECPYGHHKDDDGKCVPDDP